MKARYLYFLPLLAVISTGCAPLDPEESLYHVVSRDKSQAYTIFNYPSVYLTSKEQQVRAQKQAYVIRNHIAAGISETDMVGLWGRPNKIQKSTYPGGAFDTLIYDSRFGENYYFVFRDKKLESWHMQ